MLTIAGMLLACAAMAKKPANFSEGQKLFESGHYEDALLVFKEITIQHPSDAQANFFAGRCYKELGNIDLSAEYVTKALQLKPKDTQFLAFAEILMESAPAQKLPTSAPETAAPEAPAPRSKWVKETTRVDWVSLGVASALVVPCLVSFDLASSPLLEDETSVELKLVGVAFGLLSVGFAISAPYKVPAHEQKADGSLIRLGGPYAGLNLLKLNFDPWRKKLQLTAATLFF